MSCTEYLCITVQSFILNNAEIDGRRSVLTLWPDALHIIRLSFKKIILQNVKIVRRAVLLLHILQGLIIIAVNQHTLM